MRQHYDLWFVKYLFIINHFRMLDIENSKAIGDEAVPVILQCKGIGKWFLLGTWQFFSCAKLALGLGTEFCSEKIPRNRLGMISVIPRKKVLIQRYSEFRGRANSEARTGTERNGILRKNEVLRN